MKTVRRIWLGGRFLLLLLALFFLLDTTVARLFPAHVEEGYFWLNDYEVTRRDHPEPVWDKVFFGNSTVIAAYREDLSRSGFLNFGLDYGVLTDLWALLERGQVELGSELVIGLNWLTLYDDFETNPGYPWHRGALEPYCYFQRDRLYASLLRVAKGALGRPVEGPQHVDQTKIYYYGSLSGQALAEKTAHYAETYWSAPLSAFEENWAALEQISAYCDDRGVRLRVVWMPWNPTVERPPLVEEVQARTNALCQSLGLAVLDLSGALDAACFYDTGHLNYEYGSHRFMEEVDVWLAS